MYIVLLEMWKFSTVQHCHSIQKSSNSLASPGCCAASIPNVGGKTVHSRQKITTVKLFNSLPNLNPPTHLF